MADLWAGCHENISTNIWSFNLDICYLFDFHRFMELRIKLWHSWLFSHVRPYSYRLNIKINEQKPKIFENTENSFNWYLKSLHFVFVCFFLIFGSLGLSTSYFIIIIIIIVLVIIVTSWYIFVVTFASFAFRAILNRYAMVNDVKM